MLSDFKKFVLRGNVVDLAVAVVVGVAFTAMVTAFVVDLITPLIAAIFGKPDFSEPHLHGQPLAVQVRVVPQRARCRSSSWPRWSSSPSWCRSPCSCAGSTCLPSEEPEPETRECPECLSDIPVAARRCAFCTSEVGAPRRARQARCAAARAAGRSPAGGPPRSRRLRRPRRR